MRWGLGRRRGRWEVGRKGGGGKAREGEVAMVIILEAKIHKQQKSRGVQGIMVVRGSVGLVDFAWKCCNLLSWDPTMRVGLQYASGIDMEMVLRVYLRRREGKRNKRVERGGELDHVITRRRTPPQLHLR